MKILVDLIIPGRGIIAEIILISISAKATLASYSEAALMRTSRTELTKTFRGGLLQGLGFRVPGFRVSGCWV